MKIKLTYKEFMQLFSLFTQVVQENKPTEMDEKLLQTILVSVYKKLHAKSVEIKKHYSLKLTPIEAIAFHLVYNENPFPVDSLIGNLLNRITAKIHQQFATN